MKGYLLDTNIAIRAAVSPESLPASGREAMENGPNYLSVIVYWEVLIKTMKGLLDIGDPGSWWQDSLDQLAAEPLPLHPEHIAEIQYLPAIHKDPFDRALIAQAISSDLALLTIDEYIARYGSARFHVIS